MTDRNAIFDLVRDVTARPGYTSAVGTRVLFAEPGEVHMELARRQDLLQFNGFFHGGVISGLADHAVGRFGTLPSRVRDVARMPGVLCRPFHGRSDLVQRCRGLFQARSLLFGPTRQIARRVRHLGRCRGNRRRASRHSLHRCLELFQRLVEVGLQLRVRVRQGFVETEGQILLRKACDRCADRRADERSLAFDRLTLGASFLDLRLLGGDRSGTLHLLALDQAALHELDRIRDLPDFVGSTLVLHLAAGVAGHQCAHTRLHPDQGA